MRARKALSTISDDAYMLALPLREPYFAGVKRCVFSMEHISSSKVIVGDNELVVRALLQCIDFKVLLVYGIIIMLSMSLSEFMLEHLLDSHPR